MKNYRFRATQSNVGWWKIRGNVKAENEEFAKELISDIINEQCFEEDCNVDYQIEESYSMSQNQLNADDNYNTLLKILTLKSVEEIHSFVLSNLKNQKLDDFEIQEIWEED